MPAVLVHGVPEDARLWDDVVAHLRRDDVVCPNLPGFTTPRPPGFSATKEAYAEWLVGEVERVGEPVDLVGHDWGGGFAARLVSTRPELVRSWVIDTGSLSDPEFEWHDFAKLWQTPGEGETFFEGMAALSAEDRAATLEAAGVPHDAALRLSERTGPHMKEMGGCILDLYRSAVNVNEEWGPDFREIDPPGMIVIPSEDPFLNGDQARRTAARVGARVADLQGLGHWWVLQDPARAAGLLEEFWSSV
jgi:pimeloyl-ACP methyl ester carboxylesterase